ncbi:Chromosome-partitioning protein Spo0J [Caloramator mitchellensis]|uniref:Chromosome-partitioning protein Spo0J n=1 Tax=Caloramator mitchellensis TaxID=908809 RepID=A0A0R3JZH9_CALMK|nr:ParB/RepB/Spo0J family partition protein [Caloramator mitchellensis]KRQ85954.1 Chromosome-partitioning protein Spo0J [Caloramator mitchellensis]
MAKKSALGKGLGALIPETEEKGNVQEVEINKLFRNDEQPRRNFDEEKINALAESIKSHGIIQPIVVKREGEFYKIIAGERRWRAAKIAGLKKVPIVEKELSQREIMEISLIENIQREDLNPVEEALAYKRLMEEFELTQEEIAARVGKSRSAIANSLRILNLDERVLNYIINGELSEGHGKVIVSIEDNELQFNIAKKVVDEGLNVRQTEKLVKEILEEKKEKKKKNKEVHFRDVEEKLQMFFGTKVKINNGKNKGKIEIEYYSDSDLQRILELLNI